MKYTLLSLVAAVAMLPCQAVQYADTYEAAKELVKDDGFIVFAYAEDWDKFSKHVCDKLMESEAVQKAAGEAVFMRAPIPNFMNEERKKADKERFGPMQVGDAPSYPAIIILNKEGKPASIISGAFMRKAQPKKVSKMISERLEGMKKRDALLAQAATAKGIEKAKLLGESTDIPDITPYDNIGRIAKEISNLDPEDKSGWSRRLKDPFSFVGEIVGIERDKAKGWEQALDKVKEYLKDPVYTTKQKQALHALAIGLLRRHAGLKGQAEIIKHSKELEALDKKSYVGRSAQYAEREWATGFNLSEGWTPAIMQTSPDPVELEGPLPIKAPGTYTITFIYEKGSDAACISAVTLNDGDTKVAEDRHEGFAGKQKNTNTSYKLKVDAPLKNPHLYIEFNQKGKNNSFGHISITRG